MNRERAKTMQGTHVSLLCTEGLQDITAPRLGGDVALEPVSSQRAPVLDGSTTYGMTWPPLVAVALSSLAVFSRTSVLRPVM